MPVDSPLEIDLDTSDFNPHQYSFTIAKADGIHMGRMLMKDEILRLIKAVNPSPTKAIARVIELVEGVRVEPDSRFSDSVR